MCTLGLVIKAPESVFLSFLSQIDDFFIGNMDSCTAASLAIRRLRSWPSLRTHHSIRLFCTYISLQPLHILKAVWYQIILYQK